MWDAYDGCSTVDWTGFLSLTCPRGFWQKVCKLWQKIVQRQYLEALPRSHSNLPLLLDELDFMKDGDSFQLFALSVLLGYVKCSFVGPFMLFSFSCVYQFHSFEPL